MVLKGFLLAKKSMNYQSGNRRHVVDCVWQVFQPIFDHVVHLQALEHIKYVTVDIIGLTYKPEKTVMI